MDKPADRLDSLRWAVQRSIRYHARRRAFFSGLHRANAWYGIVFGTTIAAGALGALRPMVSMAGALILVSAQALDLVAEFAISARNHLDLERAFADLAKRIATLSASSVTALQVGKLETVRLEIEAREPPIKRNLDVLCHNELVRSQGLPAGNLHRLNLVQRALAQVVDVGADAPGR